MFKVSEKWKSTYPGAVVGALAMSGVTNPKSHQELDQQKRALERELKTRFSGYDRAALKEHPVLAAYIEYYKRFRKTYHIQLQLESVVFQDKQIPGVSVLVEAMFMAELKNLLLTAGHDLDAAQSPFGIDVAEGGERYTRLNGRPVTAKAGDMMITDAEGIISSIIYGPDQRTRIRPETQRVLFTVYAPVGIGTQAVHDHLEDIRNTVSLVSPGADVEKLDVYQAT